MLHILATLLITQTGGNPQPDGETLTALRAVDADCLDIATRLTTPTGPRRASPFIKAEDSTQAIFWRDRILRPAIRPPTGGSPWRGVRYDDFDVLRFDTLLPNGDTVRYVDMIGYAGLHVRHAQPETVLTKEAARAKLVALVHATLLHPTPGETNIVEYLKSVDLPSGRKLWYGVVTLGEVLDPNRRVISPHDWYRHLTMFTDGRTSYLQWTLRDSALPPSTSASPRPGGDAGRRILRF